MRLLIIYCVVNYSCLIVQIFIVIFSTLKKFLGFEKKNNCTYFVALYVRNNEYNTNLYAQSVRGQYNLQNEAQFKIYKYVFDFVRSHPMSSHSN